jgi:hypothetical protein
MTSFHFQLYAKISQHFERNFGLADNCSADYRPGRLYRCDTAALGWGQQRRDGEFADVLHVAEVPYVAAAACNAADSYAGTINPSLQMCAGDGRQDACRGDSGGPLLIDMQRPDWDVQVG